MNLKLNASDYRFFNSFSMKLSYDSVASAFSFSLYFDPDNPQHKTLVRPGAYQSVQLQYNGTTMVTGLLVSPEFNSTPAKTLVTVSGYSKTGVLEDCPIPVSLYPLQYDNISLQDIAQRLIQPFGLSMTVDSAVQAAMNETFDSITARESDSIKGFLAGLAAQKNILLSHTTDGRLLFTRANTTGAPLLDLDGGGMPAMNYRLTFDGQKMHSTITVMKQADADGGNTGEESITNPFATGYRPTVKVQTSGTDINTADAIKTALAEELKNIRLTISIKDWEIDGRLLLPNNIISVRNKELFLYNKTRWFIESIDYAGDESSRTATLNCVLPEVYAGGTPQNIFA